MALTTTAKITKTITIVCTVGRSRSVTACRSMLPSPGMTNTFSITTAPMRRLVICSPVTVSTGSAALRSPWAMSACPGLRPFARAVRMKSSSITSSTAERT